MRLGVVSDTHGHLANSRLAIARLAAAEVQEVLHCGDIGSIEVVALFSAWPTHFVFGNVDRDRAALRRAISDAGHVSYEPWGEREIAGRRIAFLHGDDAQAFAGLTSSGEWDLICYGHTHLPDWRVEHGTRILNPGAIYRARPHSLAIVTLPQLTVEYVTF